MTNDLKTKIAEALTDAEIKEARRQLVVGHAAASQAVKTRGIVVDPRIVAARQASQPKTEEG